MQLDLDRFTIKGNIDVFVTINDGIFKVVNSGWNDLNIIDPETHEVAFTLKGGMDQLYTRCEKAALDKGEVARYADPNDDDKLIRVVSTEFAINWLQSNTQYFIELNYKQLVPTEYHPLTLFI